MFYLALCSRHTLSLCHGFHATCPPAKISCVDRENCLRVCLVCVGTCDGVRGHSTEYDQLEMGAIIFHHKWAFVVFPVSLISFISCTMYLSFKVKMFFGTCSPYEL